MFKSILFILVLPTLLLAALFVEGSSVSAREQWAMSHPQGEAPTSPVGAGKAYMGNVNPRAMAISNPEAFTPEFWKGQAVLDRVPVGTVLSGVMDDTLSSAKNKPGDVFSISLPDGFFANNLELIPKGAKIVGKVLDARPAYYENHGNPGRLQISLQTLILPDGTNIPFFGFIARNQNIEQNEPPPVKQAGYGFSDLPGSFMGWMGNLPMGMGGYSLNKGSYRRMLNQGNDYVIEEGDVVPVRLNRTIVMPEPAQPQYVSQPNGQQMPYGMSPNNPDRNLYGQPGAPVNAPTNGRGNYVSSGVPGMMTNRPQQPMQQPQAQPMNVRPQTMSEMSDPF